MICPQCKKEVELLEEFKCPECGHQYQVTEDTEWVIVHESGIEIDAEIFKAHFKSLNIPVQCISQLESAKLVPFGQSAIVKIFVPAEFKEDALKVISTDFDTMEIIEAEEG